VPDPPNATGSGAFNANRLWVSGINEEPVALVARPPLEG
jgi:hypothetical protein